MVKKTKRLSYSAQARADLFDIWVWTELNHGETQAESYQAFLLDECERLASTPELGPTIDSRPDLRLLLLKWKSTKTSHGHYAVYRIEEESIEVLHFFHSSQDWPSKLLTE